MNQAETAKLSELLEQWNDADEFSRCIEAIEAIPEQERGYFLTVKLSRAYSNLAVLGDHRAHGTDGAVDGALIRHAIDLLESVCTQGENDPYWNARMGYSCLMAYPSAATAYEYAKHWLDLAPEDPNAPTEESNGVSLGTPVLHVETLEGDPLPFNAQQQGSTLRVTTDNLAARLHGNREALEALREQGVEQIEFVTSFKTTTLSVEDLLAEGGSWFALEHNGLVSRQLSAAQAESLKCRMR